MNIDGSKEVPLMGPEEFTTFLDSCEKMKYKKKNFTSTPLKGKAGNDPKKYKHFNNAKETMQEFMKVLSIANECVIENGDYQGPSPDEIELVKFSKKVGFELVNDKPLSIKVKE